MHPSLCLKIHLFPQKIIVNMKILVNLNVLRNSYLSFIFKFHF